MSASKGARLSNSNLTGDGSLTCASVMRRALAQHAASIESFLAGGDASVSARGGVHRAGAAHAGPGRGRARGWAAMSMSNAAAAVATHGKKQSCVLDMIMIEITCLHTSCKQ